MSLCDPGTRARNADGDEHEMIPDIVISSIAVEPSLHEARDPSLSKAIMSPNPALPDRPPCAKSASTTNVASNDNVVAIALSIEALPGPACIVREGAVTSFNHRFAEWIGRSGSEIVGRTFDELVAYEPTLGQALAEAERSGDSFDHHLCRRSGDGAQSLWSIRARRVDADVLLWAIDITAFAHAAQSNCAAQRDYVTALAHELRPPLAAIKAWAGAASTRRVEGPPSSSCAQPSVGEALQVIGRQVDRMDELLTDLLEVARTDAGSTRSSSQNVPVDELVRRAVEASAHADRVTLPDAMPSRWVMVDPLLVEAVMGKLIKYVGRRQGEAPIAVGVEEREGEILVSVVDRGPPLPMRIQNNLFGRFSRASRRQGAGVGLYICQQLMVTAGGRIWFEPASEPPRFVIGLPDRARDAAPNSSSLLSSPESWDESPTSRRAVPAAGDRRARVLFAEPDTELLAQAVSVLRLQGHDVLAAASGELFWKSFDEGEFDVVVVDLSMPGVGGLAALPRLRARRVLPAVVVTARPLEREGAYALPEREGAQAVLLKPFDWPHLCALVHSATAARFRTPDAA